MASRCIRSAVMSFGGSRHPTICLHRFCPPSAYRAQWLSIWQDARHAPLFIILRKEECDLNRPPLAATRGRLRPRSGKSMIIESSDQVPRFTLLKRFPVPRNFKVTPESRIETGRTWPAPARATRVKAFEIYRYDPDFDANPRLDTFHVDLDDCGPMVLDALFW